MVVTDEEVKQTTELLKKLEPGFLPYPLFEQVARLVALPTVEFVPLRKNNNVTEVLLIARVTDDPLWPGMLHTPGTVIRATDFHGTNAAGIWLPFERLLKDELKDTKLSEPNYVGSLLQKSKRGVEQAQLYWVEVLDQPVVGEFYAVDSLPDSLIEAQRTFIAEAARHFDRHSKER